MTNRYTRECIVCQRPAIRSKSGSRSLCEDHHTIEEITDALVKRIERTEQHNPRLLIITFVALFTSVVALIVTLLSN